MEKATQYKLLAAFCVVAGIFIARGLIGLRTVVVQAPATNEIPSSTATSGVPIVSLPTPPEPTSTLPQGPLYQYIVVTDSCGPYLDGGPCLNMRSGPGTTYPVVLKLRNDMVLKVANTT